MKKIQKGRIIAFFLILIATTVLILSTVMDTTKNIKLGLDLQGGFEILYEVKPLNDKQVITEDTLKSTVETLQKRIDVLGVSEPSIQIEGENRIRIQLAGVKDQNKAREMISTEANLTFRDVQDKLMLDGSDLKEGGAQQTFDQSNQPIVSLQLKNADKFGKITEELSQRPEGANLLVIWMDYKEGDSFIAEATKEKPKFISAPRVGQTLNTTDVVIEGGFELEEAQKLASLLNAGSLPVELNELYSNSVSAKFGEKALEKTIFAGYIGVALIFLFMIVYYRLPGVIAVITLSTYIYLLLVLYDWMNAVLTLPGIAAFVLGIGMAVDANILTYERIKDEIKLGRSIKSAFKVGSKKSFLTILDSNITTIIAGCVLFIFGTSSVKGFAITLNLSILLSFLTAVSGTRLLLGLWVNSNILNKKPQFFGVKEEDINEL